MATEASRVTHTADAIAKEEAQFPLSGGGAAVVVVAVVVVGGGGSGVLATWGAIQ